MRELEYFKEGAYARKVGLQLSRMAFIGNPFEKIYRCASCPRSRKVGLPVLPEGKFNVKKMWVGACPGKQEVYEGIPFNPKAPGGDLLTRYFKILELTRDECFITNCCFCLDFKTEMGTKDRLPTATEEDICASWKVYEWTFLTDVKYIFLLGKNAIRQALGSEFPSPVYSVGYVVPIKVFDREMLGFICHHPGYILRRPRVWKDQEKALYKFKKIMEAGDDYFRSIKHD